MPTDKLTDTTIRKAQPSDKPKKLSDGGGLYLELHPNGARYWRLKYRITGVEKRLSLGVYPETTLAQARRRRDEARTLIAEGTDPSSERKASKEAHKAKVEIQKIVAEGKPLPGSFEAVAREWMDTVHTVKVSTVHSERTRIRFEKDAFPWIGSRPISEIDAPELLKVLRRVTERGAIETAHRLKDACGQVFRYGIAAGLNERNPAADLRDALPPVQTRHLAAIVEPKEAGKLLRDIAAYQGGLITRIALNLSALLLLRPGELRHMEWSWVDFDAAQLTVPGEIMKRKKADKSGPPHIVPLAPQATQLLRELQPLTGAGLYVFPALTSCKRCMSENTVRGALRRMGYGNDDMTAHGFRAMARTMAAERLGIAPEVIEAQLAHVVPDALGRAYNRTQYLEQRSELMTKWADYLDQLRRGADVLQLELQRA